MEDQFGGAVAAGDFDGDGRDDLAVGARLDNEPTVNAGTMNVLYGTAAGLSAARNQLWHQDSSGVRELAERNDHFGATVAGGDFNGDGRTDLAISAWGEELGTGPRDAGLVHVLYAAAGGLAAPGNQLWHQNSSGIRDATEQDDLFGAAVASGGH